MLAIGNLPAQSVAVRGGLPAGGPDRWPQRRLRRSVQLPDGCDDRARSHGSDGHPAGLHAGGGLRWDDVQQFYFGDDQFGGCVCAFCFGHGFWGGLCAGVHRGQCDAEGWGCPVWRVWQVEGDLPVGFAEGHV
uniref:(northern house mosquito) hypothetical protein n=1 Tax=Culex pipiens TaxID=7175 RepID=A0A8D8J2J0_CULPI